ncbi:MAG: hypothetical protein R3F19_12615 [Verrucomicrobiales bacterium]
MSALHLNEHLSFLHMVALESVHLDSTSRDARRQHRPVPRNIFHTTDSKDSCFEFEFFNGHRFDSQVLHSILIKDDGIGGPPWFDGFFREATGQA